ncbi:CBO0543 family protein [Lentibacillus juripiscarius]|uniref:CBO0543 family protein n=2 Tax=Lentibacillus juripiscarius TaxID=257446 RepID=A0ABW5V4A3_9BACI
MHLIVILIAIIAAWYRADWSRFREFHATILYLISMNLLYYFFTVDYRLWVLYSHVGLPVEMLDLFYTFLLFPCTVMLYLTGFPHGWGRQVLHIGKWVLLYFGFEAVGYWLNAIHYFHGWSLIWSFLLLMVMFPMLRLHYKRPFLAYGLSVIIIIFLLYWFDVPWTMKA